MRKLDLKLWEYAALVVAAIVFVASLALYISDIPLRNYLLGWHDASSAAQIVGKLEIRAGTVRRQLLGESEFRKIGEGTPLHNLDTIVTGDNTTASVELDDGSSIDLGPNTMIRLAFEYELSLGGISRAPTVDVVVGQVSGSAKQHKIVLRSKDKVYSIPKNTVIAKKIRVEAPKPPPPPKVVAAAPTHAPPPPKPRVIPKPTPTALPKLAGVQLSFLTPKDGSHIRIEKGSQVAERPVGLEWMQQPRDAQLQFFLRKLPEKVEVLEKIPQVTNGKGFAAVILKAPGEYQWEFRGIQGEKLASEHATGMFTLDREFQGIELLPPLIAGQQVSSNKLQGELIQDFSITFRWKPYPNAPKYVIRFSRSPEIMKSVLIAKETGTPEFLFNKGQVYKQKLYYQVSAALPNGFIAYSPVSTFAFNFLPPVLSLPKDRSRISTGTMAAADNSVLLTWQKTNFTSNYVVEISTNPDFSRVALKRNIRENFFILKAPRPGSYWWRVTSYASNGTSSAPSTPFEFSVTP